jgi:hypothetical protein
VIGFGTITTLTTVTTTDHGFFDRFGWSTAGPIIAAVTAATIAATIAVVGYTRQRRAERRAERANLYAQAIAAVEDYLEAPYRIRRKDGTATTRHAITSHISGVKSRISLHQALLELHAPTAVWTAYDAFVKAAQEEAGPQMTDAWHAPRIKADTQVPLGVGYDRTNSNTTRSTVIAAMKADLTKLG